MRRLMRLLLVSLGLTVVVSCETSTNPASNPQEAKLDKEISGVWEFTDKEGGREIYVVGPATEEYPAGFQRLHTSVFDEKNRLVAREDDGDSVVFTSQLGERYLNFTSVSPDQRKNLELGTLKVNELESFFLFRYEVDGNQLKLYLCKNDLLKKHINDGAIKGQISRNTVHMTDTTENVGKFLKEHGKTLFGGDPLTMRRLK